MCGQTLKQQTFNKKNGARPYLPLIVMTCAVRFVVVRTGNAPNQLPVIRLDINMLVFRRLYDQLITNGHFGMKLV